MADKHPRGRPRKFKSAKELEKAIQYYFDSITITEPAWNSIIVGYEDKEKEKPIYKKVPVLNNAGEQISRTSYYENPSVIGMCLHIGIHRDNLLEYAKLPEFHDTIKSAKSKIERYLEEQLYRRDQVTGIIFNLKNNFEWKDKQEVESKNDTTMTIKLEGDLKEWSQ